MTIGEKNRYNKIEVKVLQRVDTTSLIQIVKLEVKGFKIHYIIKSFSLNFYLPPHNKYASKV